MKKIKVHIDPRGYVEKPSGKEIGGIKARLQKGTSPSLVTLEELVLKIETGHAISPGIMGGMSAKDWIEQQLFLVDIDWPAATVGWVTPAFPKGSMLIIMSVLGAVVMPHNLFLHSEVIQSHEYNKKDDASIKKVLKYELFDTLFSMIVGWAINSAMILLAAATFFKSGIQVEELQQAQSLLEPLLGSNAAIVFALALLMAGISSTITSGMAAGSIFAGIFGESYHIKDSHSQVGVLLSLGIALLLIFFIGDPFKGLIISQMILSIQLPFTVFLQVGLTSSRKVMGEYVNSRWSTFVLYAIAIIVSVLNIMLLFS